MAIMPPTRFQRGINFTPGEGGRINHGDPMQGPPKHPLLEVGPASWDKRGYSRVTVLVHQDAYGPGGPVPSIDHPLRRVTWDEPDDRLAQWPVCTYEIRGNSIVNIREVEA